MTAKSRRFSSTAPCTRARSTRAPFVAAIAGLLAAAPLVCAAPAHAEPPGPRKGPIYVLPISTDDSDDQADALTRAIRARVRTAQGWSLAESSQSFETLAIALRCPPEPDASCMQRVGDQLRADHYVWGTMASQHKGEVTIELHLWSRGKPEADTSYTYQDNLRDPRATPLRAVAAHLFARLTGSRTTGTVIVHAGHGGGAVVVDGAEKGALEGGLAYVDVTSGVHSVGVHVPGYQAPDKSIDSTVGADDELTFNLVDASVAPPASEGGPAPSGEGTAHRASSRKILGYSAIAGGAVLLTLAVVETSNWISDKNASDDDRMKVPASVTDVCTPPGTLAGSASASAAAADACQRSKDASTASALGWVFAGAGTALAVTGVVLLATGSSSSVVHSDASSAAGSVAAGRVDFTPSLGPRSGSLGLRVRF